MRSTERNAGVAVLHEPGLATPALTWNQGTTSQVQAALWGLEGAERSRWDRIVRGAGVERRSAVLEPGETMPMSTAQRMEAFAHHAPPLAARAAREALQNARAAAAEVTDLIIVTCTGFRSPGVGQEVADALGLGAGVRHSQIGFMGCFGGVTGARAAAAMAAADPGAVVLLVCIELCSLHMRADRSPHNLVACALFSDGAAASIFTHRPRSAGAVARVDLGRSVVVPGTADAMTWRVTDDGFAMTLSREVPHELERRIGGFVAGDDALVIHPGGGGIVDAVESGVRASEAQGDARGDVQGHAQGDAHDDAPAASSSGLPRTGAAVAGRRTAVGATGTGTLSACAPQRGTIDPRSFGASRAVLREHGNMSSGSVYFVLRELRQQGVPVGSRGVRTRMVAFGPGLTVDSVALLPLV